MHPQQDICSLAIVSVLSPRKMNENPMLKRKSKLQTLPGAWIEDNNNEEDNDEQDKENIKQFVQIVSATPSQMTATSSAASDEDIEFLKQTIANLRKEKEKLEETNNIVKKSIQIVARKRIIAQTNSHLKKTHKQQMSGATTDEEEDIYIIVPSDFMPTQEEMKAAGLDGWEWISAY